MKAIHLIIVILYGFIFYNAFTPLVVVMAPYLAFSTTPEFTQADPILGYDYIIRRSTGTRASYATISLPDFITEGRHGCYYVIDVEEPSRVMYEISTPEGTYKDIRIMQTTKGETLVIMHGSETEGRHGGNCQVGTRLDILAESGLIDDNQKVIVVCCYPGNQEIYSRCDARMYSDQHHGPVVTLKFDNKVVIVEVPE